MESGVLLTTGDHALWNGGDDGPDEDFEEREWNQQGDIELETRIAGQYTREATSLEFDVFCQNSQLEIQYQFGSEEYPEFVNFFNDGFMMTVDGVLVPFVPDCSGIVAVNSINDIVPINDHLYLDDDDVIDFRLPVLEEKLDVPPSMQFEKSHNVDLLKHECDCAERSYKRQFLPAGSLGRAHKHMVKALDAPDIEKQIPRLEWNGKLFELIRVHSDMNKSLEPLPSWKLLKAEAFECVVSWGDREWCHVYANGENGVLERFGYHLEQDRWAYGTTPPGVESVTRHLTDPEALAGA
ncbi:MAG: hypothetical protein CMO80_08020 [Verrucomicrobiales bacterium]|nr:hypothetical protein [Verrucomicrobiales bacterium]|tara:strand:+ start:3116 stop:4003 length:888 start_codon:yes stop_codon:yes gene_type:complete